MDEKGNIIKQYRKTGESLTTLTGFIFDTRVGATANSYIQAVFQLTAPFRAQLTRNSPPDCFSVADLVSSVRWRCFIAVIILQLSQQLLQLPHQKINYYYTLIRVTSLSCEKVHRTFSTKIKKQREFYNPRRFYFGHSCWRNRQRFRLIEIFD